MTTTPILDTLTSNAVALDSLLAPYNAKLATNTPLTPQEFAKYQSLTVIKDALDSSLDTYWKTLVKKPSLIQRIFKKN